MARSYMYLFSGLFVWEEFMELVKYFDAKINKYG